MVISRLPKEGDFSMFNFLKKKVRNARLYNYKLIKKYKNAPYFIENEAFVLKIIEFFIFSYDMAEEYLSDFSNAIVTKNKKLDTSIHDNFLNNPPMQFVKELNIT